jgi:hypothetical protein
MPSFSWQNLNVYREFVPSFARHFLAKFKIYKKFAPSKAWENINIYRNFLPSFARHFLADYREKA